MLKLLRQIVCIICNIIKIHLERGCKGGKIPSMRSSYQFQLLEEEERRNILLQDTKAKQQDDKMRKCQVTFWETNPLFKVHIVPVTAQTSYSVPSITDSQNGDEGFRLYIRKAELLN